MEEAAGLAYRQNVQTNRRRRHAGRKKGGGGEHVIGKAEELGTGLEVTGGDKGKRGRGGVGQ